MNQDRGPGTKDKEQGTRTKEKGKKTMKTMKWKHGIGAMTRNKKQGH